MTDFKNQTARRSGVHAPVLLATLVAAALLSACGGGGGSPGTVGASAGTSGTGTGTTTGTTTGTGSTTGTTASPTVGVVFANASGASTNTLTSAAPLTVSATVLDASKKPVPNAIVTFATDNTLAAFSPTAGTALTDANGIASVTMHAVSLAGGAGTVTASSTVAGTTVTGTSNYALGATALAFGTLSASPASIQAYGSTTLSVDLLNGASKYTNQSVNVSFSSACVAAGKATLASSVSTVNGTAQTTYRDQGCGQADTVTVSANGVSKSTNATLQIAAPAAASVQFLSAVPSTQSLVIKGQGGNGRTETATLTYKVVDINGQGLANKTVNFTASTSAVTVNIPSGITDSTGTVFTTVNSGTTPTSFRVQATLPGTGVNGGTDISTYSDSVVVTNGQPVQAAVSISSGSFNVEGWTVDNAKATTVTVMLADANGNRVPDGTPIVFQTNMGSVGSSSSGGCNTVNGQCTVDFGTQNPRAASAANTPHTPCNGNGTGVGTGVSTDSTRVGLATVCASTTDGTNTLFGKTAIFFSGSGAVKTTMAGSAVSFDALSPNDLGSIGSAATKVFQLQLNDVNNNPLPQGTTVAITSALNVNAAIPQPATVPNVAPHTTTADDPTGNTISTTAAEGSIHTFSIGSTQPTGCTGPSQGSFNVTITSPGGTVTNIPFKLSFSCP